MSCPICMEDTKSFWLNNGSKKSWFDCHRQFLEFVHPSWQNKDSFRKNKTERKEAIILLSGLEVWHRVCPIQGSSITRESCELRATT
ncbi:hypothetical protein AHAS_Ahas18G0143800 [Arachis hypogaea]